MPRAELIEGRTQPEPPEPPPAPPSAAPQELTEEEADFMDKAATIAAGWVNTGSLNEEQSNVWISLVEESTKKFGIQPNIQIPFYQRVYNPATDEYETSLAYKSHKNPFFEQIVGAPRREAQELLKLEAGRLSREEQAARGDFPGETRGQRGARLEAESWTQFREMFDTPLPSSIKGIPSESVNQILGSGLPYGEKLQAVIRAHSELTGETLTSSNYYKLLNTVQASLSPEELKALARSDEGAVAARRARGVRTQASPFRFETAFEDIRATLTGSRPWRRWFESRYSSLVRQYRGAPAEQTEVGWTAFLKKRKPELKEEFFGLSPFQRGERPSAFAPKVRSVRF